MAPSILKLKKKKKAAIDTKGIGINAEPDITK